MLKGGGVGVWGTLSSSPHLCRGRGRPDSYALNRAERRTGWSLRGEEGMCPRDGAPASSRKTGVEREGHQGPGRSGLRPRGGTGGGTPWGSWRWGGFFFLKDILVEIQFPCHQVTRLRWPFDGGGQCTSHAVYTGTLPSPAKVTADPRPSLPVFPNPSAPGFLSSCLCGSGSSGHLT